MNLNLSEWPDRSAYFLGRWHDLATQLCMAKFIKSGDTVVDVGANRGMFALAASKLVGDDGRVISFEPNPDCIFALGHEVSVNSISNIEFHQYALGNSNEELCSPYPLEAQTKARYLVNSTTEPISGRLTLTSGSVTRFCRAKARHSSRSTLRASNTMSSTAFGKRSRSTPRRS